MATDCVVTGFAFANAAGFERSDICGTLSRGRACFSERPVFGSTSPALRVGAVQDACVTVGIDRRLARKIDRGTMLALSVCDRAIMDAALELRSDAADRCGMLVGNATGGWGFVEPAMYSLYADGMQALNAYVATAWFPAAAQGEFSIRRQLQGYTKTIAADALSSGLAIEHAARLLANGRADAVLAGGTEAPLNALVYNAYRSAGLLSARGSYQPFDAHSDGRVLGEGASFLVLESSAHAEARGARAYARVSGIGRGQGLQQAMRDCLERAHVQPSEVDLILLDARGEPGADSEEYAHIAQVFAPRSDLYLSAPKSAFGDLVGARTATDIALAVLCIENQTVYPTVEGGRDPLPCATGRHVRGAAEAARIDHVLVNARDESGRALCFLLSRA